MFTVKSRKIPVLRTLLAAVAGILFLQFPILAYASASGGSAADGSASGTAETASQKLQALSSSLEGLIVELVNLAYIVGAGALVIVFIFMSVRLFSQLTKY